MHPDNVKRIGLMGGTFDPVHFGHLLAAERAREEFALEKVYFIPSGNPPHKNYPEMANASDRYKMVDIAIRENPSFVISDVETLREGNSYTIDTVNQFIHELGESCELYFIIGTDNVGEILKWKDAAELVKKVRLIAMTRPGSIDEETDKKVKILKEYGCRISIVEMPLIHIDSTEIRSRVHEGSSIKYLMPEEVEEFIEREKLYK